MDDSKPTLEYAAAKARSRPRLGKWAFRVSLAVLILAGLYAALLVWLYVGWKQEQPAREMVARVGGRIDKTEPAGPAFLKQLIPARLGWIRERVAGAQIAPSAADDDLSTLRRLARLKRIFLDGTHVTDAGLEHLKGLTGLQELYLDETSVTDAGLVHLRELTGLKELFLDGTQVTDKGLPHLKALTGLQELSLNDTEVTDAGLVHLKGLTALQGLSLASTQVTDHGLVHLKGLTGLRELYLDGTQVTDAGLVHLKGLTGLQCLCIRSTYIRDMQVTNTGVAALQKALPACRIYRWPRVP